MKDGIVMFEDDGTSSIPKTPEAVIREKLIFLLQYHKGTNPVDTDYGTNLHTFTHRPIDIGLEAAIKDEVNTAVISYMPYVKIKAVSVSRDGGNVGVRISYNLTSNYEDQIDLEF